MSVYHLDIAAVKNRSSPVPRAVPAKKTPITAAQTKAMLKMPPMSSRAVQASNVPSRAAPAKAVPGRQPRPGIAAKTVPRQC